MISTIAVFFGGGFGALVRYFISKFFSQYYKGDLPVGTLFSNLISCLVVGVFLAFLSESKYLNQNTKLFIIVGFCGGLSTFSTFSLETIELLKSGSYYWAIVNVALSILLCFGLLFFFYRKICLLYTSPSPRDRSLSRMPSSA